MKKREGGYLHISSQIGKKYAYFFFHSWLKISKIAIKEAKFFARSPSL